MTITQLITNHIPKLSLQDKVNKALGIMNDFDVNHLCIILKDKFIGTVCKDDLLSKNENALIEELQEEFDHSLVFENNHFSKALSIITEKNLSLIPVLNSEKDFVGTIVATQLLSYLNNFIGSNDLGGIIVLEVEKQHYSFSEISRLVETNDAFITQLNTQFNNENGLLNVTIKLNKVEISDIIATLQRFDYNVTAYYGEETYNNELKENYSHLLHYLNL